jgi:16S rRNA (guanine966-N2)-methyltransferase|uniref:16S rRNA (Guanine(966)-N(2))-methyltransferase RsmD n=1 Tax=Desulfobacca acetoxidans TaxID=60893 RepID=A0A7C3ZC11_9BACT
MRIIAGEFKGRRLAAVKGRIRPTSDKVREAIFNILGAAVAGARVLDLFAGTGALALEALSRGALDAVLVEEQASALRVLQTNLEALGLADRVRVLRLPVHAALKKLAAQGRQFSLVFLDPPYGRGLALSTLEALADSGLLGPEALVVAEHSHREALPERTGQLALSQSRRYGDTQVSFYGMRENLLEQELSG